PVHACAAPGRSDVGSHHASGSLAAGWDARARVSVRGYRDRAHEESERAGEEALTADRLDASEGRGEIDSKARPRRGQAEAESSQAQDPRRAITPARFHRVGRAQGAAERDPADS